MMAYEAQTRPSNRRGVARVVANLRRRTEPWAFAAALALPRRAKRTLAGKPIQIDGLELELDTQILLRLRSILREKPLEDTDPAAARARMRRQTAVVAGSRIRMHTRELRVGGATGDLRARLYEPGAGDPTSGLLLYLHGGAWVLGDIETYDPVCRALAHDSGIRVLSFEYRLAPEHPFPAGYDDAVSAFSWTVEHAADLGADPARIAVGGDSAGGNLAAAVALAAARGECPQPAFQLLVYPSTHFNAYTESRKLFGAGFVLTEESMQWGRDSYLPQWRSADLSDPRLAPGRATDLHGLAPAYITTAGFDTLRDEAEEFASDLAQAGVQVTLRRHNRLMHGFVSILAVPACRAAVREAAEALRTALS